MDVRNSSIRHSGQTALCHFESDRNTRPGMLRQNIHNKTAFLSAPECTENEAHGHLIAQVLPDVFKFISASTEHEHQGDGREGAGRVDVKGLTPNDFPTQKATRDKRCTERQG